MSQSKLGSLTESCLNIGSGFVISMCLMTFIISPLYKLDTKPSENLSITVIFTVVSVIRTYIWRRIHETQK